jgi:prevent-host-death family protein
MERVGIRELRNYASRVVARARAGERIVITVDGVPVAEIGPIRTTGERMTMEELIAAGRVIPPRNPGPHRPPPDPIKLPDGVNSLDIINELREDRF